MRRYDVAPRAEEDRPFFADETSDYLIADPCPESTEDLIDWLRRQFPEVSPRTSDPRVIDACIARKGVIDAIDFIAAALWAARKEQKDADSPDS